MSAIASTLVSDQPLRVLNASLNDRLGQVIAAQRALRAAGYVVRSQDLRLETHNAALLRLEHGDEMLRQQLRAVLTRAPRDGRRLVTGRYMDVDVSWECAA